MSTKIPRYISLATVNSFTDQQLFDYLCRCMINQNEPCKMTKEGKILHRQGKVRSIIGYLLPIHTKNKNIRFFKQEYKDKRLLYIYQHLKDLGHVTDILSPFKFNMIWELNKFSVLSTIFFKTKVIEYAKAHNLDYSVLIKNITLWNINDYNLQEIFDKAAKHLLDQNCKSMSNKGILYGCSYRGRNNTKCAVGIFIDDIHYQPKMEAKTLYNLININLIPNNINYQIINILNDLQLIHDGESVDNWKKHLINLADKNNLNTKVIDNHVRL